MQKLILIYDPKSNSPLTISDVQIFSLIDAKSELSEVLEVLHSFVPDELDKIFIEHYEGTTGNKIRKVDNAVAFMDNELIKLNKIYNLDGVREINLH